MQGKSCFNFAKVDEPLLAELEALTKRGYEATAGDPRWGAALRREEGLRVRSKGAGRPSPDDPAKSPAGEPYAGYLGARAAPLHFDAVVWMGRLVPAPILASLYRSVPGGAHHGWPKVHHVEIWQEKP
jgi:hypothetical protein